MLLKMLYKRRPVWTGCRPVWTGCRPVQDCKSFAGPVLTGCSPVFWTIWIYQDRSWSQSLFAGAKNRTGPDFQKLLAMPVFLSGLQTMLHQLLLKLHTSLKYPWKGHARHFSLFSITNQWPYIMIHFLDTQLFGPTMGNMAFGSWSADTTSDSVPLCSPLNKNWSREVLC